MPRCTKGTEEVRAGGHLQQNKQDGNGAGTGVGGRMTTGTLVRQVTDTSRDVGPTLGDAVSKRNVYDPSQRRELYVRRRFDPESDVKVK